MRFLNNLKVGSKIILLVIVMIIFIITICALGLRSMNVINTQLNELYDKDMHALSNAKDANIYLVSASRGLRNIILTQGRSEMPTYIKGYDSLAAKARDAMKAAFPLIGRQENKTLYQDLMKNLDAAEDAERGVIELVKQGKSPDEIFRALVAARGIVNKADDQMTVFTEAMSAEAKERAAMTDALYERSFWLSIGSLAGALIFGGLFGWMIKAAIANPLISVAGKADLVAGGDLGQNFHLTRSDEIGQLAGALEKMVENLRMRIAEAEQKSLEASQQSKKATEAMAEAQVAKDKAEAGHQALLEAAGQVELVVARLSTATEELSAQVEESSRSAEMQRDRVTTSATSMEEMNATVLEVARNAGVAAEGSDSSRQKAQSGAEIVKKSIEALSTVRGNAETLNKEMEQLGHQAESIGAIMTVISDIADQTNLLALNAAIEAARAGEAGRGFAVVADEVRKLAEKTMTATKEVGAAIGGIQQGTQRSISAMGQASSNLGSATELATQSGTALAEIVKEADRTADQVRNIAAAAEEQSAASEEITHSLEEINRIAVETATVMQQSSQAVMELSSQTNQLQALVQDLRRAK